MKNEFKKIFTDAAENLSKEELKRFTEFLKVIADNEFVYNNLYKIICLFQEGLIKKLETNKKH